MIVLSQVDEKVWHNHNCIYSLQKIFNFPNKNKKKISERLIQSIQSEYTELKDPPINEDNVQGKCKITIFKSGST